MPSTQLTLLDAMRAQVRPPVAIVLGAPRVTADLATILGLPDVACYQMDLHQADRLREDLSEIGTDARVEARPDLWDLPAEFNTVLYAPHARGERELKRDMVEQSHHILRPRGRLIVFSPVAKDDFFPGVMKKIFGKVMVQLQDGATMLWSPRGADQPRRRHEIRFQVRTPVEHVQGHASLSILSRPGVFTYGRMDDGARALWETATIRAGDQIIDLGCGAGAVGLFAGLQAGLDGSVTFVDSNLRAAALAEINARANGLREYHVVADARLNTLPSAQFDLALANPPYYAQNGVARLFIEKARQLLRPGGRLYVVTKQADVVESMMQQQFGETEIHTRRNYVVLKAVKM